MSHDLDERFQRVCFDLRSSPAVHDLIEGRSLTFGDLHEQYQTIGRALRRLRVGPGSTVVALVGNRSIFFPLMAACLSGRTALLPIGDTTDEEATSVIARSGARAIVTDRALPMESVGEVAVADGIRMVALPETSLAPRYGESVVLKLTSGSTDLPKAAVAGIRHLVNDGRHVIEAMAIGPSDVNFACIPLSHSYALGNVVMPLLLQGTAVALRQSFNPTQCLADIESTGATVFPGVPFMFDRFRRLNVERLPARLRLLITAGARIDPATVGWFHRSLGRKVHSFYGSSETGGITYDDGDEVTEPLTVGRPMPETVIDIRSPDGTLGPAGLRHTAAAGAGRIFVSGTAVATAYADHAANDPDAGFADGGFLTGDVGCFDDEGRLFLTGRVSTLVNVAGLKVDPAEVERVLLDLPGIAEVRVMGASCDRRGQQLVAFIVSDQPLTSVDLRQRCARTLSPHKIPRQFIFLDQLPLDARGKTDRRALEALAADAPA
jgi:acyl-CoA synthetase (AMP-forming)/AMP-acid ligase II